MEYVIGGIAAIAVIAFIVVTEKLNEIRQNKFFVEKVKREFGTVRYKEFTPERFAKAGSYLDKHKDNGSFVDDITWSDLDLDTVFRRIDTAHSSTGEEYLYYLLHKISLANEELNHFNSLCEFFDKNEEARVRFATNFHQIGFMGKYSLYDYIDNLDYLGKRSSVKILFRNLLYIPAIALFWVNVSIAIFALVGIMVYNIIGYFKEKSEVEPYITSFAYIMRLVNISKELIKTDAKECEEEFAYIKKRQSAFTKFGTYNGIMRNTQKTGSPLDILIDYLKMTTHFDIALFNFSLSEVKKHIHELDEIVSAMGLLESALCVADYRRSVEYCVPEFTEDESKSYIKDLYHPLIEGAVKNDTELCKNILLTGSNASGKSTFLKSVAINLILAQTIYTCTASKALIKRGEVFSSMALRDNIFNGESYFIVEVKALKRVFDEAKDSSKFIYCFVDEVLKGTNTIERVAASSKILEFLPTLKVRCFAATHDIELCTLLKNSFKNMHFEEKLEDGNIVFDYLIKDGPATSHNAIGLLESFKFPSAVTDSAKARADIFSKTGQWS